jgi:type IV pilus assembly protein PilA
MASIVGPSLPDPGRVVERIRFGIAAPVSSFTIRFSKPPEFNISKAMWRKLAWFGALAILLAGAGCGKRPAPQEAKAEPKQLEAVTLVAGAERSRHFEAVNRHLELGGTLYLYADIDGDAFKLARAVRSLADNIAATQPLAAPYLDQDYQKIFAELGLADIKALGLSSVPASSGGFRNRVFFYTPEGRHGLLAGFGGPPAPVRFAKLAPADVDLFSESEFDLPAVYATVKALVARVAGEGMANLMETRLKEAGNPAGLSVLDVIKSFKGRSAMMLRLDPEQNITLPGATPVTIPAFSLLLRIDGAGGPLEGALARLPVLEKSQEGALNLYTLKAPLPVPSLHPVVGVEGTTLYLATSREFLLECYRRQTGLDQNPGFKQALASLGPDGNGVGYLSPRLFNRLRQLDDLNPNMAPDAKRILKMIIAQLPMVERPLVTVRTNLPDGILIRSHWNRSLKQDLVMVSVYNPVTVGVLAAMAIPAFQKVRQTSQDKAILNNLRMLNSAAEQYYLEHRVNTATYGDLVGPDKYIRTLQPVAGEDYRTLQFRAGQPLRIRTRDGRWIPARPPGKDSGGARR